MIRGWLDRLRGPSDAEVRRDGAPDQAQDGGADAADAAPEDIAARFLADPDHFVDASIGDGAVGPACSGNRGFRIEVVVSGVTLASARSGTLYVADDGETTAEIAHYEVGPAFRGLGVAVPAARSIFRHMHRRHRVTRVLFVAPVARQQREPFRAFVARIGAEPFGHFADDPAAPPLFAWSARRALD
jgi:hypothetical protein